RESQHTRLATGFVGLQSCLVAIQLPCNDISNTEITGPSGPDGVTPSRGQAFTCRSSPPVSAPPPICPVNQPSPPTLNRDLQGQSPIPSQP
ncbi:hypothetical protein KUCAC02_012765, partial [Chaenocephalus aceratus]